MPRRFIFTDEAGDFAFKRGPNVPNYFIVCSITLDSCDVGETLLRLRRQLAWEKAPIGDYFHASEDKQAIRDRVFEAIRHEQFRVDATILEKAKAQPHTRASNATFYKYAWYFHFKHIGPRIAYRAADELHLTTASISTKKGQAIYTNVVNNVVQQVLPGVPYVTTFTAAGCDPCLQLADYCTWAIQRKWEKNDLRSYALIQGRITSEFNLWRHGRTYYY